MSITFHIVCIYYLKPSKTANLTFHIVDKRQLYKLINKRLRILNSI
ncbi:hypothetical protein B4088_0961 [Bacillus cereus]|uniref:Uncharacterized protein n=1 Tax=Bacillus cereus TaxID=1396 RepID=A0A164QF64_BACCE|nr:hypothetical protein B4088_0961 [Bacillus cereus]